MDKPYFSVIILYWRAAQFLPRCLASLNAQTFKNFEIILLNNGSDDEPDPDFLAQYPELDLRLLHSEKNLGFAAGNNLAAKQARGDYLVLLNADAFPSSDWLEKVYLASLEWPEHFFASRLVQADNPDFLDGEWNVLHVSGLAWRQNHNRSIAFSQKERRYVISACAAAGVYPKVAFDKVKGFDEDFFAYMEDLDLDMRLQLAGYPCLYLPDTLVYHVGSGSAGVRSEFSIYHGQRNLVWNYVKNMPGILFYMLLPVHLFFNLAYLIASPLIPNGKAVWKAKWDAIKGLPKMWRKRQEVQASCIVAIRRIAKLLNWNPFSPLLKLLPQKSIDKEKS